MSDSQQYYQQSDDRIFVIETCENCKEHQWNTRHDQAKYEDFFNRVSSAIVERVPGALAMRNQIPKSYVDYDIYCNLIPNEDESSPYFQQVPRTGAFEVSYKGLLIFSKLGGCYWPNVELVANKCLKVVDEEQKGNDVTAFLAGMSPQKDGGFQPSTVKGKRGQRKPVRMEQDNTISLRTQHAPDQESIQQVIQEPEQEPSQIRQQIEQYEEQLQQIESASQPDPIQEHQFVEEEKAPSRNSIRESVSSKFVGEDQAHESVVDIPEGDYDEIAEPTQQEPEVEQEVAPVELDVDINAGPHLADIDDLVGFPVFPEGTTSLLSKYLSREMWGQFNGPCFKQCILSGCANIDSEVGIYATKADDYKIFAPLFDPIVAHLHGKDAHHEDKAGDVLDIGKMDASALDHITHIGLSIQRNISAFPFGPGVTSDERLQVEKTVCDLLGQLTGDLEGQYKPLEKIEHDSNLHINEHDRFGESAGLNRDWPHGRGVFVNQDSTLTVQVNLENHMCITSMQEGGDIASALDRLQRVTNFLRDNLEFAFDDGLGYLTTQPANLGTTLNASLKIHLPNCNAKDLEAIAKSNALTLKGENCDFDLSTQSCRGRSQIMQVQDLWSGVEEMIAVEMRNAEVALIQQSNVCTPQQANDHGVSLESPAQQVAADSSRAQSAQLSRKSSVHQSEKSIHKSERASSVSSKKSDKSSKKSDKSSKKSDKSSKKSEKAESVKGSSKHASVKELSVHHSEKQMSVHQSEKAQSVKGSVKELSVHQSEKAESVKALSVHHSEKQMSVHQSEKNLSHHEALDEKAVSEKPASVRSQKALSVHEKELSVHQSEKAQSVHEKAPSVKEASVKAESVKQLSEKKPSVHQLDQESSVHEAPKILEKTSSAAAMEEPAAAALTPKQTE